MVSKEKFVEFCERVEKTEKGIERIEGALGSINLRENEFCALANYAYKIAFMLMDITKRDEECFTEDFYNIIDTGKSEVCISYNDGRIEEYTLNNFDELYDYWKE